MKLSKTKLIKSMNIHLKKMMTEMNNMPNDIVDEPEYAFYIINPKTNKIVGGWDYPEDAKDHIMELREWHPEIDYKTISKSKLRIDRTKKENWENY